MANYFSVFLDSLSYKEAYFLVNRILSFGTFNALEMARVVLEKYFFTSEVALAFLC